MAHEQEPHELVEGGAMDIQAPNDPQEVAAQVNPPPRFSGRGQAFCFTLHDPEWTDEGYPLFADLVGEHLTPGKHEISAIIFQCEVTPTTGREHLQGYFETKNQTSFPTLHRFNCFNGLDPWITKANGTCTENIRYCSKVESRAPAPHDFHFKYGDFVHFGQGRRTDIIAVKRAIDSGVNEVEVWRDEKTFEPMLKYHKGFDRYRLLVAPPNNVARNVVVYWGPTGTGKSHTAKTRFPNAYRVPHPKGSGTYWDGYTGQTDIIVEEMNGSRFSHNFLLDMCGDTPVQVPIHGGSVPFLGRNIVFTADSHPGHWYRKLYAEHPQLWPMFERRIAEVHNLTERYLGPEIVVRNWPVPPLPPPLPQPDNRILFHP